VAGAIRNYACEIVGFYFYQAIDIELFGVLKRRKRGVLRFVPVILADLHPQHQMIDIKEPWIEFRLLCVFESLFHVESRQIEAADAYEEHREFVVYPDKVQRRVCQA